MTNTADAKTYERTLYEARLDAECYAVSHDLHARLWRRVRLANRIIIGFMGSAAFGGWLAIRPDIAGIAGLAVALMTAIDQAFEPSDKIATHRAASRQYIDLKRESIANSQMTLNAFDAALESIKSGDEAGIDALMTRAFNRVVVAAGRPECCIHESFGQRFVSFFA